MLHFLGLVCFISVLALLITRYGRGLHRIPGPFAASILPLDRLRGAFQGRQFWEHQKYHQKYGEFVRVGPNHVSIAAGAAISQIYGIGSKFAKSEYYSLFDVRSQLGLIPTIFSTRSDTEHRAMKRSIAQAYSMSTLVELEPMTNECIRVFIRKMYEHEGEPLDFGEWLQWYAFDVITSLTFSNCMGFMQREEDISGIINALDQRHVYTATIGEAPYLHKLLLGGSLSWILEVIPYFQTLVASKHAVAFAARQVERYKRSESKLDGLKDMLARFRGDGTSETMSDVDLLRHAASNIFAGSDTTAISLRAIFYYLLLNKHTYDTLQEEIRATKLSGIVTYAEASKMQYLQACMKEAMRLHPAVGQLLERVVPPGGATIEDVWLPGGTIVGINPWVVSRDRAVYGEDADGFRPERWLESSPEQLKLMERNFLAFGAGARVCLGKNISLLEMSKLVPQVLRDFDVTWARRGEDWELRGHWFVRQSRMICQLQRREHGAQDLAEKAA